MKIKSGIVIGTVLLAAAGLTLLFLNKPWGKEEEEILWREYQVEEGSITASFEGAGKITYEENNYSFPDALMVGEIHVEAGDEVKKGDILVSFSKKKLEQQLETSKDAVEKAQRAVEEANNNIRLSRMKYESGKQNSISESSSQFEEKKRILQNEIDSIQGRLFGLDARRKEAQAKLDEQKAAAEQNQDAIAEWSSKLAGIQAEIDPLYESFEQKKKELEQMDIDRQSKTAEEQSQWTGKDKEENLSEENLNHALENAKADVEQAKAEIARIEALLKTPDMTAKEDGIVTAVQFKAGEEVPAGQSIVKIGQKEAVSIQVPVSQEDINKVEINQKVEMSFTAYQDQTFTGIVVEKGNLPMDGKDGVNYSVTIQLDQKEQELLYGMTCNVKFIQKQVKDVLTLSNKAIEQVDGKQKVRVKMPDGTIEERFIETGFSDGYTSEILSGLKAGEIVVKEG